MKELSIEQKAEAYDEAIKRAKSKIKNDKDHILYEDDIIDIFPELKESDGEKIRKSFAAYFARFKQSDMWDSDFSFGDVLTWIEEQGKKDEEILILKDQIESLHAAIKALKETHRIELEKQGKQILANSAKTCKDEQNTVVVIPKFRVGDVIHLKDSCVEYTIKSISDGHYYGNGFSFNIVGCDHDYELVKQKPWSEEDKKMSRFIGNAITADDASIYLESKGIQVIDAHVWLDGLKERVLPQPKQEWSEEDENRFNNLIFLVEHSDENKATKEGFIKFINKLKSLRPQNWNPSKEQMAALKYVVNLMASSESPTENDLYYNILKSLREQLKKLRDK